MPTARAIRPCTALDPRPGPEARLDERHPPSESRAGRLLQRELVAATGARDLGIAVRGDLTGFNWADVPAVLVETGFMSNPREAALLRSARYQQRLAGAIAGAAQRFVTR